MGLKFKCAHCGKLISIEERNLREDFHCPECRRELHIPSQDSNPGHAHLKNPGNQSGTGSGVRHELPKLNRRGTKIGKFVLGDIIGHGAMGTVYRATGPGGEKVAIKIMHPHLTAIPEFARRFRREAQLAARLAHPNVVKVLDYGMHHNLYYIVMEYVSGKTLADRMQEAGIDPDAPTEPEIKVNKQKKGKLTAKSERPKKKKVKSPFKVAEVIKIMRQAAGVLQAAADIGMVHRDIKPHNILLDRKGNVKLHDFGLAKDTESLISMLSMTGQSLGTPPYMSPEQHEGSKKIDIRSDLYSLGATAYHLLAGRPPFTGTTAAAYARQHIEEIPEPLDKVNPDIAHNFSQVLDRLLAKKPQYRHHDPTELIEDLNRVERGEPPLKFYKPRKVRKHSPLFTYGSIAAAMIVTLLVVFFYQVYREMNAGSIINESMNNAKYLASQNDYEEALNTLNELLREYGESNSGKVKEIRKLQNLIIEEARHYRKGQTDRIEAERQRKVAAREAKRKKEFKMAVFNTSRLMREPETLPEARAAAVLVMRLARGKDETVQAENLFKEVNKKLAERLPWAAVVDFTIDKSVKRNLTGGAMGVKVEQSLAGGYRLVARNQIKKALNELKFQSTDLVNRKQVKKLGKFIGAEYLITGSVVQIGEEVTVAAQIIRVETGTIKQTAEVSTENMHELNNLFLEIGRILTLDDAEKQAYMNEKIKYPKFLSVGKTLMSLKNYPDAVNAFKKALLAKHTKEAARLLSEAEYRATQQRIFNERRKRFRKALNESEQHLKNKDLSGTVKSLDHALKMCGYQYDLTATDNADLQPKAESSREKKK